MQVLTTAGSPGFTFPASSPAQAAVIPPELWRLLVDFTRNLPFPGLPSSIGKTSSVTAEIRICTFGHKHGVPPTEADLLFDARSIPNPHSVPGLERSTGLDKAVIDYLSSQRTAIEFLTDMWSTVAAALSDFCTNITGDGKRLVIAIGCKGGRQRSVFMAMCCELLIRWITGGALPVEVIHQHLELDLMLELAA
jgi:RNase adaptor protein for sRNA GlmZ degradation